MSEEKSGKSSIFSGFGFIDQIVDGLRSIGESLKVQDYLDDAFYMAGKGIVDILLNLGVKYKIEGTVGVQGDLIANRGLIYTMIASNVADFAIITQVAPKKMAFVVDKKHLETPMLKSLMKTFGVICTLDEFVTGEKDDKIYVILKQERKILALITDDDEDPEFMKKVYEKLLVISRDGFAPIKAVGIKGSDNLTPGAEIILRIGDKLGVNQKTDQEQIKAMALDLIEKLKSLKE
ncbi:MAG: hypothetical protein ACTSYS_16585 [Promethearchaeota archaeon]